MRHDAIIDLWPSLSAFAGDVGVAYGTAKAMRRRQSIPPLYWGAAVRGAKRRKIAGVSHKALSELYSDRRTRRSRVDTFASGAAA